MAIDWADVTAGLFSLGIFSSVGLLVLVRGGRGLVPRVFGSWLLVWGLSDALLFGGQALGVHGGLSIRVASALYLALGGMATVLVLRIPAHIGVSARGAWPWFVLWGAVWGASYVGSFAGSGLRGDNWLYVAGIAGIMVASFAGLSWYAVLGRRTDARTATHLLAISVALAAWPLLSAGASLNGMAVFGVAGPSAPLAWAVLAGAAAPIALWATTSHVRLRTRGPILILGFVAWGQVITSTLGGQSSWLNMAYVVAMAGMAGYTLFHDRFIKLDLGLRWTISRASIPSAAIIAFFVASEGAQVFFGARAGNEYVGIAAAAVLLLALRPLQALADRAAGRAVPGVPTVQPFADPGEIFRMAVRAAMLDGRLTGPEELELARLQERLRLSAEAAALTRVEVARDLGHA